MPGMMLMLRAMLDIQVISWHLPLLISCAVALCLVAAAAATDRGLRRSTWTSAGLVLLILAYGYGGTIEVNTLLDGSKPDVYNAAVLSKYMTRGARQPTTWNFKVTPWGGHTDPNDVQTSRALYENIDAGDVVCLNLRSGALAIAWFVVRKCD
jgi:hypothetical protein